MRSAQGALGSAMKASDEDKIKLTVLFAYSSLLRKILDHFVHVRYTSPP